MRRRNLLAALGAAILTGCSKIGESAWFGSLVDGAEKWHRGLHRGLGFGRIQMAPEYARGEVSPFFRGNGNTEVDSDDYRAHMADGFARWRFTVGGLVDRPLSLSLADLRALPQRTQVTRHDCVEGWSAIAEWTGPQLSAVLAMAGVQDTAQYVVFRCADSFRQGPYYESCDMDDALHPQTILAHTMNGADLPELNGAPLRLRIERQLGYKHAKYLTGIELVEGFGDIGLGQGGYWEDHVGYQWYAGI